MPRSLESPQSKEIQQATALKYAPGTSRQEAGKVAGTEAGLNRGNAPKITAQGEGDVAQQIFALAQAHGVMTHADPLLAQALAQFEVGTEIPPQLYTLIAELIAFSYVLQGKFPDSWEGHIPISERV